MDIYPVTFYPILKERIWGGVKLKTELGKDIPGDNIGESWEISGVEGDVSVVANGPLQGKSLQELIEAHPEAWLGKEVVTQFGAQFPILIKFIDAATDLSIQVHPDDKLAEERHGSFGKNEMWYIMDADRDSRLILGFEEEVSKAEYKERLNNGELQEILMELPVKRGDAFFIHAGLVHAIGGGILLAEIQQTSDITYRLYDYDRKDAEGNSRELHTELALDAIDFKAIKPTAVEYPRKSNASNNLINTPFFKTEYVHVDGKLELFSNPRKSFTILMGVGGNANISTDLGDFELRKGNTLLIPAITSKLALEANGAEVLDISI